MPVANRGDGTLLSHPIAKLGDRLSQYQYFSLSFSSRGTSLVALCFIGFCDGKCSVRCKLKGRDSRCFKYCMMCCGKCRCVPSGTFGNLNECPCYRDWKSPNGRPKCP